MQDQMAPIVPAEISFEDATPVSNEYDDSYFMRGQGLAESQAVFIEASRLAERFDSLHDDELFVIGETGFGTGLNCLLAARCFMENAPAGACLHLVSAERHPLKPADLRQALAAWPELAELAHPLQSAWPAPAPGYHRLRLADNIELTLMLGDAAEFWESASVEVDAWFLDGFAPAKNPAMWTGRLFQAIASHSRPGSTVATFTAAGLVRRGLEQTGFQVNKVVGFGGKRHRLTARRPGPVRSRRVQRGRVLIAGAGLAGASSARAFAERGWQVLAIDPDGVAQGASGNLAGVIHASASACLNPQNRFYQLGLCHALRWFDRLGFPRFDNDGQLSGVVHCPPDGRRRKKFESARNSGAWPEALLQEIGNGRFVTPGGFVRPRSWCQLLLDHPGIEFSQRGIVDFQAGQPVRIELDDGSKIESDILVICMANATKCLPGLDWLPLNSSRGQVSYCRATPASQSWRQPVCHAGFLTPAVDGLHSVGATFDRDSSSCEASGPDDRANLAQLKRHLPDHYRELGGEQIDVVTRRAALRCQSRDRLPLVGALPNPQTNPHVIEPGIWLNLAHGSRGITQTPLCADLIADRASGCPPPADPGIIKALAPERFVFRNRRRQSHWRP